MNRGWYIGTTTLDFERSSIGSAVGQQQAITGYIDAARHRRSDLSPVARMELADRWIEAAVARNLSYRVITMQATGQVPNYEASIAKLFNTELSQRIANTAMKVGGLGGLLVSGDRAAMRGLAGVNYLTSVSSTIAGGTSEIQRNIVAQRGLGLPR